MADFRGKNWWAWQGLNLRPLRCQHSSVADFPHKSAVSLPQQGGTERDQTGFLALVYRTFAARVGRRRLAGADAVVLNVDGSFVVCLTPNQGNPA